MLIWWRSLQVAFTFIGTVVGAGFASGREVMQFFTRFGNGGALLIVMTTALFIWIGSKMMLLAARLNARSYEDLNKYLFGERIGRLVSYLMLFILLAVNGVMIAGAGTIFSEHLGLNYQIGMLVTAAACFLLLRNGISAILAVNSFVAPIMILFTLFLLVDSLHKSAAGMGAIAMPHASPWAAGISPLLYAAFNLSLAQAVLVPLGSSIGNPQVLRRGAWIGGLGIGLLLLAGHYTMIAHMPEAAGFDIPMGGIAKQFSIWIHGMYILLIYSEIFTTLIADVFGLEMQLQNRIHLRRDVLTGALLALCFIIGQFGFAPLLSTLYPLIGLLSLGWLFLISRDRTMRRGAPPAAAPPKS